VTDIEAYRSATATGDLQITAAQWTPRVNRLSSFELTILNHGRVAAWLDIRLAVTYADAAGARLETREVVIKQILQPESREPGRPLQMDGRRKEHTARPSPSSAPRK
jgi:hypothetical protein